MKPKDSPRGTGSSGGARRIAPLPMEWMDPMSWRLPSGKALAEFALQSGFLMPLMLSGGSSSSSLKTRRKAPEPGPTRIGEVPDSTGTFRENK